MSLFVACVLLGSSIVAARAIMDASDGPATLGASRYLGSGLILAALTIGSGGWRFSRGLVLFAIGLGVIQFGVFHLAINTALQQTPAARGAVIFALIPILTMMIAAAAGRDRVTPMMIVAAIISFAGVALAVGEAAFRPSVGGGDLTGEALFFLAICCGATYNAFSARLYRDNAIFPITVLTMVGGFLFLMPFSIAEGPVKVLASYDGEDWVWWLWCVIFAGAMSMGFFNYGLRKLGPSQTAIYVPISPIATTAMGAWLLGETITSLFLVGLACAVTGPLLVSYSRRKLS